MIIGIGVDIVDIDSFTRLFNKSKRFRQRVFTEKEIEYCDSKPNKYQHYAVRFVAKEAVMKAIGTGWDKGVQWKQIEIINNRAGEQETGNKRQEMNCGKPEVRLTGKVLERSKELRVDNIFISLSHSKTKVVAFVIIEGDRIL